MTIENHLSLFVLKHGSQVICWHLDAHLASADTLPVIRSFYSFWNWGAETVPSIHRGEPIAELVSKVVTRAPRSVTLYEW